MTFFCSNCTILTILLTRRGNSSLLWSGLCYNSPIKTTDKIDARTITVKALQLLRDQAIRLLQTRITQDEVAKLIGVSRVSVGNWRRAYQANPETGLKVKKRGRQKGADCTLN